MACSRKHEEASALAPVNTLYVLLDLAYNLKHYFKIYAIFRKKQRQAARIARLFNRHFSPLLGRFVQSVNHLLDHQPVRSGC